jgi:signal transduction histidine kinase
MNLLFLQRRISENTPERESIDAAIEGSQRIKHIIEDTLNLARVTPPQLCDEFINEIIRRSLAFISAPLQHKNIVVQTHYEPTSPRVEVDFKQIQQVLLNLIQNAIDASPEHSVIYIATSITDKNFSGEELQKPHVQITVADEGVGIPKDMWQHLFEPFRTTKAAGTGLGLMLTKYIVERHQGCITIEPGVEKGTIVKVLLPQFIITEG